MRSVLRVITVAATCAAAVSLVPAAHPAVAKSDRGSLRVVAEGVPAGRSAKITVAGKQFRKKLPAAGQLRKLRKGTYRVWAAPIVVDGGTAAVPNLPVKVKVRKRSTTQLRLAFSWNPRADSYPPGPASELRATSRTLSTISLKWVNGAAPDLSGVEVRRKQGRSAPRALDDGRVVSVNRFATSLTDYGLRPNTTYSYSVFMEDAAGNVSRPATIRVSTKLVANNITAGSAHTCALVPDSNPFVVDADALGSAVVCWGRNDSGQVGDGTTVDAAVPQPVALPGARRVVAGGDHTCAIDVNHALWCWGRNDSGQLGIGTAENATVPQWVSLPAAVVDIALGTAHTCAVLADASVWCWGENARGQLGANRPDDQWTGVNVAGLQGTTSIAAGYAHTCAVRDAHLLCWGANDHGQLGGRTLGDTSKPVTVDLDDVASVSAGVRHTCAVANGGVFCWGDNEFGQLGDGTRFQRSRPDSPVLSQAKTISAGAYHSCASSQEHLTCWGRNNSGRLGDGTTIDRLEPTRVHGDRPADAIATGAYHSCLVSTGVFCWGANGRGQLGTGDPFGSLRPLPVG